MMGWACPKISLKACLTETEPGGKHDQKILCETFESMLHLALAHVAENIGKLLEGRTMDQEVDRGRRGVIKALPLPGNKRKLLQLDRKCFENYLSKIGSIAYQILWEI